ncbi:neuronal acetylcholine receptor subunit non-alpha-2-like [Mytilus edulis]|uniref:neuronal acetylcholine receptor subunit non-alpha-2-like n=1 Tax=Mytilus edulis TaxID=6550 RepID=UPI0039F0C1FD
MITTQWMLFFLFNVLHQSNSWTSESEKEARTNTVKDSTYDRLVRPSDTVNLQIGLHLLTINFLEIKNLQLSLTGWISMEWEDERLTWVPGAGDAEFYFALDTEIWKPELFIDNSLSDVSILNDQNLQFRVENTGLVEWELPRIFVVHCDVDIRFFPFDKQSCLVELTSWAYSVDELVVTALYEEVQYEELRTNGEWTIESSQVETRNFTEVKPGGAERSYSVIDFTIIIKRNPSHYISSTILPILATSVLSILVFILPVDSGEKVGYTLTVLLAEAVLLTLVQDSMPSSSKNVSYLSVYLAMTLVLGVLCVILTVLVIRVHHRSPNIPVPQRINGLMLKMCIPLSCWRGCCCSRGKKNKSGKVGPNSAGPEAYVDINDQKNIEDFPDDYIFAWTEVAAIMDWFFFILLSTITALCTVVLISIVIVGGIIS